MRRWFAVLAALLLLAVAPPARAKPLDPVLQQQLLDIYDGYNKALAAGKLPDALALRSAATRAEALKEMKTAKDRQEFLAMAKMMVPDKIDVRHASTNAAGDKAQLLTIVSKTFPPGKQVPGMPPPGSTARSELFLGFIKEGDAWKIDDLMFGMDPAKIKACKDERVEPPASYDAGKHVSLGGPITRVDFQPDHTLIVVRVMDEETCAFAASRDELAKQGVDPATLVPYAIVEMEGAPNRKNPQKMLVGKLTVQPDD